MKKIKSGFWQGAVKADSQGNAIYCYLLARKSDEEFTIQLYWNSEGFHLLIYSSDWTLNTGEEFKGRVRIDKKFDGLLDATVFDTESLDYLFGYNEKARTAFQRGRNISLEGPAGKKSFRLVGTRRAVDTLEKCADEFYIVPEEANGTDDEINPNYSEGRAAYVNGDYDLAFNHLHPLAKKGEARAQHVLGIIYYNGNGAPKDFTKAFMWFREAASQGHAASQNYLGEMYRDGEGTKADNIKAAIWFGKAADQGADGAAANLASLPKPEVTENPELELDVDQMLEKALSITVGKTEGTPEEAFALADKAAKSGDRQALWIAGRMQIAGYGVELDVIKANARILAAAEAGHVEALTYLAMQYLADNDPIKQIVGRDYLERAAAQAHGPAIAAMRLLDEDQ